MQIKMLRPFTVIGDDGVQLRPARPRVAQFISLLAVRADFVDLSTLTALMAAQPHSVHQTVSLTRHYLGDKKDAEETNRLWQHDGYGYKLNFRPGDRLDLAEFRERRDAGRLARDRGDLRTAVRTLGSALELWGDPPLRCLPTTREAEDSVTKVLLAERDKATVAWLEVQMALGRHPVTELEALTAREPLDERWWELLMLAHYRSGRRASALQVYERAAAQLAADGLDVGDRLQQMRQRVDERDPHLEVPERLCVTAGISAQPVPQQLPADVTDFVGRSAEIHALMDSLKPGVGAGVPQIVLAGPPGAGSSALAIHVAHRLRAAFPDGQLYEDLGAGRGVASPEDVLAKFLGSLGVQAVPVGQDQREKLYRSVLAGSRVLVVLDNAVGVEQIRPLLPGTPGCAVIVTSHDQMTSLAGATLMRLGPMSAPESEALLRAIVGDGRVDAEPAAAASIVRACGGSPLALRIAGARLASRPTWPLGDFAGLLGDSRERLGALEAGGLQVRSRIAARYQALAPLQARALRAMVLLGSTACAPWAVSLAVGEECAGAVADLADRFLIHDRGFDLGRPRYQVDELALSYCLESGAEQDGREDLVRLTAGCVALLELVDQRLPRTELYPPPGRDPSVPVPAVREARLIEEDPRGWIDSEWAVLVAVVTAAARAGEHGQAAALMRRLSPYLDLHGHTARAEATWALVRDAAEAAGDAVGAAEATCWAAASTVTRHRRRAAADLLECVRVFREHADHRRAAQALVYLAECDLAAAELRAAREHAEAAIDAAVVSGVEDHWVEMAAHRCLAIVMACSGEDEDAVACAERAVALAERFGQPLYQLGESAVRGGRPAQGVAMLRRAADAYREASDPISEVMGW